MNFLQALIHAPWLQAGEYIRDAEKGHIAAVRDVLAVHAIGLGYEAMARQGYDDRYRGERMAKPNYYAPNDLRSVLAPRRRVALEREAYSPKSIWTLQPRPPASNKRKQSAASSPVPPRHRG